MFDLARVRDDFPILSREVNGQPLVYFDNAATSQKPTTVIESISDYYDRYNSNVHRGVHTLSGEATDAYEGARARIGQWFGVEDTGEVILLRGATEALNLVANALSTRLKSGDVVLVGETEHHANIVPWQQLESRIGIQVIPIPVDVTGTLCLESAKNLCREHTVAVIAIGHVSNAIGAINDVAGFIQLASDINAFSVIDGAQAAPHMRVNVKDLHADFYAVSAHKCCGPTGIGVLIGQRGLLESLPPWQGGGDMIAKVTFEKTTYQDPPYRFEAGTPPIVQAIGLGAAVKYVEGLGMRNIAAHEHGILAYAHQQLADIEGYHEVGTAPDKAAIISFLVDGLHPFDVAAVLDRQGVATRVGQHCAEPLMDRMGIEGTVRASFGLYNNHTDVDALVAAIRKAKEMLS